ncbi:hypothetical protein ARMA_2811 [Ardenticatena maritima]|uniref:Tail protein n=1 Tax=Ardenticatena maritima TaxID=872965 RepID=A0A0M9UDT2_9CHLR|nr:GPW/gp25 family protein [Ardenticatena maritima]KPL89363.1 tail protein [Ardenticatena maritima]GAP64388.1 hypothetical protein ARMA_2811 [Ardenticatena maritima]
MNTAKLFGKGISFPPRIGEDGRMVWSEGPQNIRENIQVILLTDLRERLMRPGFGGGLRTFLFQPNITSTHRLIEERVRQALARWEPRIRVEQVLVQEDENDPQTAIVTIEYSLVATQARDRATVGLHLG